MSKKSFKTRALQDFKRNKWKYLIFVPVLIYLLIFNYKPMYGVVIAFQRFRPARGISGSDWVGLDHFISMWSDYYFPRSIRNTITISALTILFSFPAPVMLALLLNEVKCVRFKKAIQTITYMPHFIALVVVCGMIISFSTSNGFLTDLVVFFGGKRQNILANPSYFYPIYILSGIWQNIGWDSIIYLAALSGIDQEQYEAARVDGAGRLKQMWHITLPGLVPTISMLLILKMGSVLSVGSDKILLLYQPVTYSVADVISTYTYRKGMIDANYSYSTAVGLFNSTVNILFLLVSNKLSKKMGQSGLF